MSRYFGIPLRNGLPLGLGTVATLRSGGASGPANSATNWYFAALGLTGTPWADVSRTGLGTRVGPDGLVGFGPHNLLLHSNNLANPVWTSTLGASSTATTVTIGTGASSEVRQTVSVATANQTFTVQAKVSVPSGTRLFRFKNTHGGVVDNFSANFTATTTPTLFTYTVTNSASPGEGAQIFGVVNASDASSNGATFTVTDLQINVGAATPFVPTTTTARYLPRITHDPVTLAPLGLLVEGQGTNLYPVSDTPSTRTVTVTATAHTLSVYGTCTITLSGAATGTLTATGAANIRTTLTFTPSAGSLTMTVSALTTGNRAQLETGSVATSYIPNPGTGSAVRVADWTGPGVALTGAALAAAFPGGVTGPFTGVIKYRKGYSVATDETLLALSAGSTAGGTNLFAVQTNGTQAKLTTSAGDGTATGTLVHDGSTVNKIAYSVDPTAVGANIVSNGAFVDGTGWTFGTGWSQGVGFATKSASGSNGVLSRPSVSLVSGKRYLITINILAVRAGGTLSVFKGDGYTAITSAPSVGVVQLLFQQSGGSALFIQATAALDVDITDVSVQEVGTMSISVNGSAAVEATGIGYTGAGVAALIPGSQTYGGTEPMGAAIVDAWDNTRSTYITGSALQALTA